MSSLAIGEWIFDNVDYDVERDVLYLSIGEPRPGYGDETPEGHILRYDEEGAFCGVTLIDVQKTLEEKSEVVVAVPPRPQFHEPQIHELGRSDLDRALAAC
jgi:uncharacterized protein YuzE